MKAKSHFLLDESIFLEDRYSDHLLLLLFFSDLTKVFGASDWKNNPPLSIMVGYEDQVQPKKFPNHGTYDREEEYKYSYTVSREGGIYVYVRNQTDFSHQLFLYDDMR